MYRHNTITKIWIPTSFAKVFYITFYSSTLIILFYIVTVFL